MNQTEGDKGSPMNTPTDSMRGDPWSGLIPSPTTQDTIEKRIRGEATPPRTRVTEDDDETMAKDLLEEELDPDPTGTPPSHDVRPLRKKNKVDYKTLHKGKSPPSSKLFAKEDDIKAKKEENLKRTLNSLKITVMEKIRKSRKRKRKTKK